VSVTVVTYNHGKWLAECLESIVTQKTNFPFEVLVGDDASTDLKSRQILADYAKRHPGLIVPIQRKNNIGGSNNNLDLMRRARGDYIATCDGDDMMLPEKLQKQAEYLDAHPEFSMVGHRTWGLSTDGKYIANTAGFGKNVLTVDDILRGGVPFANSSVMFRKSHQTIWTSDKPVIDFLFFIDRALCGPVGVINELLGVYRCGVGTSMNSRDNVEKAISYALQFALAHNCDSESVSAGGMRFEMSFVADRLLRSSDKFNGFREWNWRVWSNIHSFRFKYGVLGAYILQKWPLLARIYLRFWLVWLGNSWFWKKMATIHFIIFDHKKSGLLPKRPSAAVNQAKESGGTKL
jgi:glycosyltransferase involved in cell wall biosynthesis